jgi:hypothetical protein
MPAFKSPTFFTRAGIVSMVNASGSTFATSVQRRGAEARASFVGLIE